MLSSALCEWPWTVGLYVSENVVAFSLQGWQRKFEFTVQAEAATKTQTKHT